MAGANDNGFTPTQQRLLAVFGDGLPHTRKELHACLGDELTSPATLRCHIHLLRKKLRPKGQDILIEFVKHSLHYRHVRLLASAVK